MQVEATALLVGEESFDTKAFGVPIAGFFGQFQIGDQIDRLLVTQLPPSDGQYRAVIPEGEGDTGQADALSWLHAYLAKGEVFAFAPQLHVLGRAAGIVPAVASHTGLQGDTIELAITHSDHIGPVWHHAIDLGQPVQVRRFREMTFAAFNHQPGHRQRPFLVNHADQAGQCVQMAG